MPTIRQATADDIEILTDLRVAFFVDMGDVTYEQSASFREATCRYLSHALPQGKFLAWIAEEDGQVVATSGLVFFEQAPTPDNLTGVEGYILNMYTLPQWRGRGIARTLLQEIITHAQAINVQQFGLDATAQGRPLYEKMGFVALTDVMGLDLRPVEQEAR